MERDYGWNEEDVKSRHNAASLGPVSERRLATGKPIDVVYQATSNVLYLR